MLVKRESFGQRTAKTVPEIRAIVRGLFGNAHVESIELTDLDEAAEIAVYIDAKPSFLGGRGLVDLRVSDLGNVRHVEVVALGTTLMDNISMGMAQDVSGLRELWRRQEDGEEDHRGARLERRETWL